MAKPFSSRLAWLIDNPIRGLLISPSTLIARLPLRPHHHVLEVGPGSGFFSLELARHVPEGRLDLLDIQEEMLAKARRKLTQHAITNVRYTVADAGKPLPYAPEQFDLALLVAVLGEIPDPVAGIEGLARVLTRGAHLAIHEHLPDPDLIPFKRLCTMVEAHGLRLVARMGPGWNYTAIFRREV